jgi:hypothetical protein
LIKTLCLIPFLPFGLLAQNQQMMLNKKAKQVTITAGVSPDWPLDRPKTFLLKCLRQATPRTASKRTHRGNDLLLLFSL